MNAADARQLVSDLDADDAVAKVVADAGPLSDDQRVVLRGILLSPDMTEPAPPTPGAGPVLAHHHHGSPRDDDSPRS